MSKGDIEAIAIAAWVVSLWALMMTATSQRRGTRTLLEWTLWKWARKRSRKRRAALVRKIGDSGMPLLPRRQMLDYLQREDHLFQASQKATSIKAAITTILSLYAGGALSAITVTINFHLWKYLAVVGTLVGPILVTIAVNLLAMNPSMQRWTTDVATSTARRAYEALLTRYEHSGPSPRTKEPFHSPHITAVRALDDFARALEKYAVQRALPDGKDPMPKVVSRYAAAATRIRGLRDEVELNRDDGRKQALRTLEEMLKILSGSRPGDIAPDEETTQDLLNSHSDRGSWRRQTLRLTAFTLTIFGVVSVLRLTGVSAIGITVASASAVYIVGSWGKNLGIPSP